MYRKSVVFVFVVSVLHWASDFLCFFSSGDLKLWAKMQYMHPRRATKWIRSNLRKLRGFRKVNTSTPEFSYTRSWWKPNKKGDLIRQLRWIQCTKMWLHPRKLTWNLKRMVSKRNLLFQGSIFRFHVSFRGSTNQNAHTFVQISSNFPQGLSPEEHFVGNHCL